MDLRTAINKALAKTQGVPDAQRGDLIASLVEFALDLDVVPPPVCDSPRGQEISAQQAYSGALTAEQYYGATIPVDPKALMWGGSVERKLAAIGSREHAADAYAEWARSAIPAFEPEPPSRIILPGSASDIRRVAPKVQFTPISDIKAYLVRVAPTTMDIDVGDGDKPIRLVRKIEEMSFQGDQDGAGTVTLSYSSQGEPDGPRFVFSSGDPVDMDSAMAEINRAAKGYTREKRQPIKPARPQYSANLDAGFDFSNARGAEAEDGETKASQFLKSTRSSEVQQFLKS